ncbi:hypothetical protein OED01_00560 [Microbacterium sp. M28]|uniref:hypothetical protein n=1 Tax=Microbacterium sp. M28 TaxID=2962064 RepID=UPI0021F4CC6E|nr:hypothetical protein [Microbacterium sp. M28]UYO97254.1 hypothetical protein OED01_00560 [Microbacterium sp. M28]
MSGDKGDPDDPRDDDAGAFPPPPPSVGDATPAEPVIDAEIPGASVAAAEEVPSVTSDAQAFDELAAARVADLDIPPAEVAVPEFTVPEPPEIPPLDATAVGLLEDETAASSELDDSQLTSTAERAASTRQPVLDGSDGTSDSAAPAELSEPVPATRSELRARASAAGSDSVRPDGPSGSASPTAGESSVPPEASVAPVSASSPAAAPLAYAPPSAGGGEPPASDLSQSQGDTYRGWPFVIFALLLALLIAAVIGVIVLANNPPSFAAAAQLVEQLRETYSAG